MTMEKRPLKAFLCHASGDKPSVRDLYKRLTVEGVDAWLDREKLLPGQDWRIEIPRAVREADVVVICLSKKSITKEGYVQKEIKFALDIAEEKPEGTIFLIPARLEDCAVPERLNRWQWVDLYEDDGFIKLLLSLKLRADAVNATIEPTSYIDVDKETNRRLEQLYTEGLAAFYTEDWDQAYQRFQSILSELPNYKNAAEKLKDAKQQMNLARLYEKGKEAIQSEDWETAIHVLDELSNKSADYKDVTHLLQDTQKQKHLRDLYLEAKALHSGKQWEAVIKVFEKISFIEPNYPDSGELLSSAQEEADKLRKLARLNDRYNNALREMDAGNWHKARKLLEMVNKSEAGFKETKGLLKNVEEKIIEEKKHKQDDQTNASYEQMYGLQRIKKLYKPYLAKAQILLVSFLQKLRNFKLPRKTISIVAIFILILAFTPSLRAIYDGELFQLLKTTETPGQNPDKTVPNSPTLITETSEAISDQQDPQSVPWIDGSILVYVPQGEFIMGDEDDNNSDQEFMLEGFWIYSTEVTNKMYANCVAAGVCMPPLLDNYESSFNSNEPVVNVTWEQANIYCTWLQARLPTEAEWEKTARGPSGNIYPWGGTPPDCNLLNFDNCTGIPSFVANFPDGKSHYGAFDMAGNVFEWTADWYFENYYEIYVLGNKSEPQQGEFRSLRGSGFLSKSQDIRLTNRFFLSPEESRSDLGFRCVVDNPEIYSPNCVTPLPVNIESPDLNLIECQQPYIEIVGNFCVNNRKYVNIDIPENNDGYRIVSFVDEHQIKDLTCTESKENANELNEVRLTCNWRSDEISVNVCRLCQVSVSAEDNWCYEGYEFDQKTNFCKFVGQSLNVSCPQGFVSNSDTGCCVPPLQENDGILRTRICDSGKIPEQTFSCVEIRPTKSGESTATCNYSCSNQYEADQCNEAGGECQSIPGPCINLPPLCP